MSFLLISCLLADQSGSPEQLPNLPTHLSENPNLTNPFAIGYGHEYPVAPFKESNFPLQLALTSFRAPMPSDAGLPMFFDQEIVLVAETNLIYSVQASRAYAALEACVSDRDLVKKVVLEKIPGLAGLGEGSKFESEVFSIDLYCGYSGGSRFIELHLVISHKPTKEKIIFPDYSGFQGR